MSEKIKELKYRCNKVLPLAYDDSLSYYEVLGKVSSKLNEEVVAINDHEDRIVELEERTASEVTKQYVDDGDTSTLQASKNYTDTKSVSDRQYTDTKLTEAKTYTDNKNTEAKNFATTKSNEALASAKNYTDTVVPDGGVTGQVLTKRSGADQDTQWTYASGVPAGGLTGQVLIKNSSVTSDVGWGYVTPEGSVPVQRLIPQGGEAGQVLTKVSGSDYAVDWEITSRPVHLQSDGNTIWVFGDETQTQLTYLEVKAYIEDEQNIVYLTNGNYSFYNKYKYFPQGETNAIGFIGETQIGGEVYSYRIVINSNNEVRSDEIQISKVNGRVRNNITSILSNLSNAIAEQNLEKYGYNIGDYFVGASGYVYHLADMDTYYGGYNNGAVVGTHHCGVVVDTKSSSQWNSSGSASRYDESTLHSFLTNTVLTNVKSDLTALFGSWDSHIISHEMLANGIGTWGWSGANYIRALSEVEVYGSKIWSADNYQQGEAVKKLTIFDKFRFNEIIGNTWWWLRSLSSSSNACRVDYDGDAHDGGVSNPRRAVGLILLK